MEPLSPGEESLDELAERSRDGNEQSSDQLLASLRVRFLAIAKRRVRPDDLEDVVQEALRIVHQKHHKIEAERGMLIWSLAVLRNVIGNYYQAKERLTRRESPLDNLQECFAAVDVDFPLAPAGDDSRLIDSSLADRVKDAVTMLAKDLPRCGRIFQRILESLERGGGAREVSQRALAWVQRDEPKLTRGGFYTALHRCRTRLRNILAEQEASAGHE